MVEQTSNVLAAAGIADAGLAIFGAALGCGLTIIGAGIGIGLIGALATGAIARQPEAGGVIFRTMIVAAALVEGVTFFSLITCFLTLLWLVGK
ncbi:MAG: ATP synthase F0 subunit C [Sedimentisphaerales bacterium]|jgi:F-type H+-transporting ATPase subunit c